MARKKVVVFPPEGYREFEDFLAELTNRPNIRLAKVQDEGSVEPARRGSALVMQPRVSVTATALDYDKREILRWEKKWDVGSDVVTVHATGGRGSHHDRTGKTTRAQVTAALEARGILVSDGEWTPASAEAALSGLRV